MSAKPFLASAATTRITPLREIRTIPLTFIDSHPNAKPELLAIVRQDDIKEADQRLAHEVLSLIPRSCIHRLKNFYVRYDGTMTSRGLAGETTVIIDGTLGVDEKRAVLIHEALGHFMDLGCLTGSPQSGKSAFRDGNVPIYADDPSVKFYEISWLNEKKMRPEAKPEDCLTGYACFQDPFEDVAESAAYYLLHEQDFRMRAKTNTVIARKLQWIETYIFPDKSLVLATSTYASKSKVAWDATKLPYEWMGMVR